MQVKILGRERCLIKVIIKLCQLIARHRARCIVQLPLAGNLVAAHFPVFCAGGLIAVEVVAAPPITLCGDKIGVVRSVDNKDFHVTPP